jgi:hypothetical protein
MSKVIFDGDNKLITINSGVTDIDVGNDIYLEWKKWVLQSDNSKYLPAFRAFGGDPTTLNQTAPNYYFLINDWIVKVENLIININSNLYSEDFPTPYDNINSTILSKNSDSPGIYDVNSSLQNINTTLTGISNSLSDIDNSILDLNLDMKHVLGLVQSNYRLTNHVYDADGRLTSTKINIFYNASDCSNNINPFATYNMTALYDIDGLLMDYKVVKN